MCILTKTLTKVLRKRKKRFISPAEGGQEDHVEFSYTAAEKAAEAVAILSHILEQTK